MFNFVRPVLPLFSSALVLPLHAGELRVDINRDTNNTTAVTENGYTRWSPDNTNGAASGTTPVSRSFTTATGENVTVTFAQTAASAAAGGTGLLSNWYKAGAEGSAKLVSDGLTVAPANFAGGGQLRMTITGLSAGTHTLLTYHNAWDGLATGTVGPIDISVNGTQVIDNLQPTIRAASTTAAAMAYVELSVAGPSTVTEVHFAAETNTAAGVTIRNAMINGFEIDTPNSQKIAHTPSPAHADEHVDADSGSISLSWQPALAGGIASHDFYFGTSEAAVKSATRTAPEFLGNQPGTSRSVALTNKLATCYWRVDEIDSLGNVAKGVVWHFRPRLLAFPGAEGHGRFARGGRGGKVVHVTSLADYESNVTPVPGTFRHAIEVETGPRVIVFDTGCLITVTRRLTLSSPYVTIAGQTAPGKGICLRQWPLGMSGANDGVVRFIRNRPGNISGQTIDGGGLAGCNHSIMDHCSISWSMKASARAVRKTSHCRRRSFPKRWPSPDIPITRQAPTTATRPPSAATSPAFITTCSPTAPAETGRWAAVSMRSGSSPAASISATTSSITGRAAPPTAARWRSTSSTTTTSPVPRRPWCPTR